LSVRIALGAAIFAALALADWRRHGPAATRWREYATLLACVAVALAYGVLNDAVTSSISWEYFYYGKGVAERLGHALPPPFWPLKREAARIGLQATWSAGLLIGVALLVANNPSRRGLPRLRNRRLLAVGLPIVLGTTIVVATLMGGLGWAGAYVWLREFASVVGGDESRLRRFMAVFGVHLGGYVGGAVGTGLAVWRVRRLRKTS